MEPDKVNPPTPEELKAEEEALKEAKEEEVRAAVISEYGFDEENDAEKIEKLTKERLTFKEEKGSLTRQKIKYRDIAAKGGKDDKKPSPTEQKPKVDPQDLDKHIGEGVSKALEQRDLDAMEYPDAIKEEIKRVAQIQGVSVKKAERDPYIVARVDAWKKETKAEEATIKRNNKQGGNGGGSRKDWSVDTPPNVDMSTPEGRKDYDDWKKWAIEQESK